MNFEPGGIYHIYNQGNNRQVIFYNRDNYIFFVRKVRNYILPFGSILAWCLMPNHFHLMVEVEKSLLPVPIIDGVTQSHPVNKPKFQTFNNSIGVMLRSYTRAINKQEIRTGALFREETKAICLNEINGISSNWYMSFGITFLNLQVSKFQYPQVCFNYIHYNPVKSGLVDKPEEWEFSSWNDLNGLRNGNLVNQKRVVELGLMI